MLMRADLLTTKTETDTRLPSLGFRDRNPNPHPCRTLNTPNSRNCTRVAPPPRGAGPKPNPKGSRNLISKLNTETKKPRIKTQETHRISKSNQKPNFPALSCTYAFRIGPWLRLSRLSSPLALACRSSIYRHSLPAHGFRSEVVGSTSAPFPEPYHGFQYSLKNSHSMLLC